MNRTTYTVYPNLENMIKQPREKNADLIAEILNQRSIPIARRVIIQHYIDYFLDIVDKEKVKRGEVS